MLKKKLSLMLVVLIFVGIAMMFAYTAKQCENCGQNCQAGSCDDAPACAQCIIKNCDLGGSRSDLDCGHIEQY